MSLMAHSSYLKFSCPSCGAKLDGVKPLDSATQVVKRTCRKCGDRWQLVVSRIPMQSTMIFHRATITFVDNRWTRRNA